MKRIWWFVIAAAVLLAAVGSAFAVGHHLGENRPTHDCGENSPTPDYGDNSPTHDYGEDSPAHDYGEEIPAGRTDEGYLFLQICDQCGTVRHKYYSALLTFIDDDAKTEAMLHWERIIDATGIRMTSALIPGKIGDTTDYDSWVSYAGWDLLDRLGEKGVEYVHHTYSHQRLTEFTEEQLHEDFRKSKEILESHGIHSDLLVYPFYKHDPKVEAIAAMYYDGAFAGHNELATAANFEPYAIRRVLSTDSTAAKTVTFPDGRVVDCHGIKSAAKLKRDLDKAVEQEGWLVYVTHAYDSPAGKFYFDEQAEQSIIELCRYAQSHKEVKIVTATEGWLAAQPLT